MQLRRICDLLIFLKAFRTDILHFSLLSQESKKSEEFIINFLKLYTLRPIFNTFRISKILDFRTQRSNLARLMLTRRLFAADSLFVSIVCLITCMLRAAVRYTMEYLFANEIGRQVGWIDQG